MPSVQLVSEFPTPASSFAEAPSAMLGAILDQSVDCIKVIGLDGSIAYMNRNGQCAMEIDDFCAVAGQPWKALWPAEARVAIDAALGAARRGETAQFEAFAPTAKGAPRWWDVTISPLRGEGGTVEGFLATSRDISDRVQARDAKDAVGAELRHRLRNHFAVVGSLLSAHARERPEQQDFVNDMLTRYGALAVAQTMEAQEGSRRLLGELLPALLKPYETPACEIEVEAGEDISLDHGQIEALALVVGELAVNSTKHGALRTGGYITVDTVNDADSFAVRWKERMAGGRVEAQERDGGQGMRLMHRVLGARKGSLTFDWHDDGLDVTIGLPLARDASAT